MWLYAGSATVAQLYLIFRCDISFSIYRFWGWFLLVVFAILDGGCSGVNVDVISTREVVVMHWR